MKPRYKVFTAGPMPSPAFYRWRCIAILRAKLRALTARNVRVEDTKTKQVIWPANVSDVWS